MKPYKYNGRRVPGMYQGKFQEGKETKNGRNLTIFGKTIPERNKLFKENIAKLEKYNPLIIAAKKLGIKKGSFSLSKIKKLFN